MEKINLLEKLELVNDHWNPKIVAELNGQLVKLVKFKGKFVWHKHDNEDEMFFVIKGIMKMEFRHKVVEVAENELIVVPRGVEHRPVTESEVSVMLFEPNTTKNTGNTISDLTKLKLDKI